MAGVPEPLFPEPAFMTVEQYRQLPEQPGVIQELHWGQLVNLCFPKKIHSDIQDRLVELLRPRAGRRGIVRAEFPFRALDVAFVSQARWDSTDDEDNLHGLPELVIEVLSRSNTPSEMREKAALCLATGAEEFWIVDPKKKTVTVLRRGAKPSLYTIEDQIPLNLFSGSLPVSEIFGTN